MIHLNFSKQIDIVENVFQNPHINLFNSTSFESSCLYSKPYAGYRFSADHYDLFLNKININSKSFEINEDIIKRYNKGVLPRLKSLSKKFMNCNFNHFNFTIDTNVVGKASDNIIKLIYIDCEFDTCSMYQTRFKNIFFINTEFTNIDFKNSMIEYCNFYKCTFKNCSFNNEFKDGCNATKYLYKNIFSNCKFINITGNCNADDIRFINCEFDNMSINTFKNFNHSNIKFNNVMIQTLFCSKGTILDLSICLDPESISKRYYPTSDFDKEFILNKQRILNELDEEFNLGSEYEQYYLYKIVSDNYDEKIKKKSKINLLLMINLILFAICTICIVYKIITFAIGATGRFVVGR